MNLSQKKWQCMLEFLAQLREGYKDDDSTITAIGEIENELKLDKSFCNANVNIKM